MRVRDLFIAAQQRPCAGLRQPRRSKGAVTERIDGGKNRAYPGEALSPMSIERQGACAPREGPPSAAVCPSAGTP